MTKVLDAVVELCDIENVKDVDVFRISKGLSPEHKIEYISHIAHAMIVGQLHTNETDAIKHTLEVIRHGAMDDIGAERRNLEQAVEGLERRKYVDPGTDLPNRAGLMGAHLGDNDAVVMFDLDKFKKVNDKVSHIVGDYVLREAAYLINDQIREGLVGRYGGEEFYAVLRNVHKDEVAVKIVERARKAVEENTVNNVYEVLIRNAQNEEAGDNYEAAEKIRQEAELFKRKFKKVTVSAGIKMVKATDGIENAVRDADSALRQAKKRRNRSVMHQERYPTGERILSGLYNLRRYVQR